MNFEIGGFLNTDTVIIVIIGVAPERFKLSAFFTSCGNTKIICRVAVYTPIISYHPLFVNKNSAPKIDAVTKRDKFTKYKMKNNKIS